MQKILLIEDDITLGNGIRLALQNTSLQTTLCHTLAEAQNLLDHESFDLLILDINLPDGSGLDLLNEVRKTSIVPIILLTANDMEMDIVTGLESGAAINVNSLPMVVEMCKGSDIGKFTGYYYTATFSAQIATPIIYGIVRMFTGTYLSLFYYCPIAFILSILCILVVKHGEAIPQEIIDKVKEENED